MEELLNNCPLSYHAMRRPDQIAIEDENKTYSFAAINSRITSLSNQLVKLGMKTGDRLICIAPNSLELVLLQLTCLRAGFIFSPLNPKFSDDELLERIQTLNSAFVFSRNAEIEFKKPIMSLDFSSSARTENCQSKVLNSKDVISIIFTSGSSGKPKAVMHNYYNHYFSAKGSQKAIPLAVGDKNLLSLPLFHISGYATVMRTMIAGATLVLSNKKLSSAMLKKTEITHLSLVSTQLYTLLKDPDFSAKTLQIKHLLLGGSVFPDALLTQAKQCGFTYHLSYGSTEMASQIATSTNSSDLKVLPFREVKIEDNELLIRGKTAFVGYFDIDHNRSEMDWFASKDLGKFDQYKPNTLSIIGRKDRLFISGGENIQPEEIEKVLLSFPEITQVAVLPIKDEKFGFRPVAFVNIEISASLQQGINQKLTHFKQPIRYFKLPKQTGLKVSLKTLAAHLCTQK